MKNKVFLIIFSIIYFLSMFFIIDGGIFIRICKSILSPLYLTLELSYLMLPVSFVVLLFLTVIQLIRKDTTGLNRLYEILILIITIGHFSGRLESILGLGENFNFLGIDLLQLDIWFVCIVAILYFADKIYRKNNTRYYLFLTIPITIYALGYLLWSLEVGI
ncbi:hypothetical protein IJZ97_06185 [bacterium]|nr:hypothetical protein [bacterium]